MIAYSVTSAPAVEPLSVSEAKGQVKVLHSAEDTLIENYIKAVRQFIEKHYGLALVTQTIEEKFDEFPGYPSYNSKSDLRLRISPVQAVSSVTYYDEDGVEQTLSSDKYEVDTTSYIARLRPAPDEIWPHTRRNKMHAITVTYTAGYGDAASDVPETIRQAIALEVADMYVNRTNYVRKMVTAAERLIGLTIGKYMEI